MVGVVSNGEVLLRLGPDIERLRKAAAAEGIPMSQFLREGMEMRINAAQPGSTAMTAALRLVERVARELAENGAAEPVTAGHWDAMLADGGSG
jgi:hypothetical protein